MASADPSPATKAPSRPEIASKHFPAASATLNNLTDKATDHSADPKDHIHTPSNDEKAHSWFRSIWPYDSLADFESSWRLGNYVIMDRLTGRKEFEPMSIYVRVGMHLLYYGTEQEKLLQLKATQGLLKEQTVKMGKQYDAPESRDHIQPFIDSFRLQNTLPELLEPDPKKYPTFNDFFGRALKPSARPIADPENDKIVSSAADCRLTTFPTTDLATKYWIKGFGFTTPKLLDSDTLAQNFAGGPILIHRLAPQDYHRWHSPCTGTVVSITEIPGTYYTVNPQAINEPGTLDVFCENRRSVMIIKRLSGEQVAVVAVGAMLVGSIKYLEGVKEGAEVKRGQCLGVFLYGGSTVIALYPKDKMRLDADLVLNSEEGGKSGGGPCETLVRVGERVGVET